MIATWYDTPEGEGLGRNICKTIFTSGNKKTGRRFLLPKGNGKRGYGEEIVPSDFAAIEMVNEESMQSVGDAIAGAVWEACS